MVESDDPQTTEQARPARTSARLLAWLFALSCVIAWAGWHTQWSAARPEIVGYNWRRTTSGWERIPSWRPPTASGVPTLHPLLLTSLQLIASLLALSSEVVRSSPAGGPPKSDAE